MCSDRQQFGRIRLDTNGNELQITHTNHFRVGCGGSFEWQGERYFFVEYDARRYAGGCKSWETTLMEAGFDYDKYD